MRLLAAVVLAFAFTPAAAMAARPDFQPLDRAPARVASEAWRISDELARQIAGYPSGEQMGCWDRGGHLPWRCLSRVGLEDGSHYDIVSMIGHSPTMHTDTGKTTYGPWGAQRFRVVYGAEQFTARYGFSEF